MSSGRLYIQKGGIYRPVEPYGFPIGLRIVCNGEDVLYDEYLEDVNKIFWTLSDGICQLASLPVGCT